MAIVFAARTIVLDAETVVDGGGLLVVDGCVERVLSGAGALRRAAARAKRRVDLGEGCLVPGWVNAHAHLELSDLEGRLPSCRAEAPGDFAGWVRALLGIRGAPHAAEIERAVLEGSRRALASGTTLVGDIDSQGHQGAALVRSGPRLRLYREVLDARDPSRTEAAWHRARRALPKRERVFEGLSPHAPFTVSDALLAKVAQARVRRSIPIAMHWAESIDEQRWSAGEPGPLRKLVGAPPPNSAVERLDRVGLLGDFAALIHANHATAAERTLLAERGAHVVHCPGSHAFFGRAPFDLAAWRGAGINVALGTDSLASNVALDMGLEVAAVRCAHPAVDPRDVFRMATVAGAAALGLEDRAGALRPGMWADFSLRAQTPRIGHSGLFEALTEPESKVLGTWVGGRSAMVCGG